MISLAPSSARENLFFVWVILNEQKWSAEGSAPKSPPAAGKVLARTGTSRWLGTYPIGAAELRTGTTKDPGPQFDADLSPRPRPLTPRRPWRSDEQASSGHSEFWLSGRPDSAGPRGLLPTYPLPGMPLVPGSSMKTRRDSSKVVQCGSHPDLQPQRRRQNTHIPFVEPKIIMLRSHPVMCRLFCLSTTFRTLPRGPGRIRGTPENYDNMNERGQEDPARPAAREDGVDHRFPLALGISKRVLHSGQSEREAMERLSGRPGTRSYWSFAAPRRAQDLSDCRVEGGLNRQIRISLSGQRPASTRRTLRREFVQSNPVSRLPADRPLRRGTLRRRSGYYVK